MKQEKRALCLRLILVVDALMINFALWLIIGPLTASLQLSSPDTLDKRVLRTELKLVGSPSGNLCQSESGRAESMEKNDPRLDGSTK